jgi:hypothetical protein
MSGDGKKEGSGCTGIGTLQISIGKFMKTYLAVLSCDGCYHYTGGILEKKSLYRSVLS